MQELLFSKSHEWVKKLDETTVLTGLSEHAVTEMGDIVFINLPSVGATYQAGQAMADVESVKAVSDVYSPVSGTVAEVNESLINAPENLNSSPYESWIAKFTGVTGYADLMTASEYENFIKG